MSDDGNRFEADVFAVTNELAQFLVVNKVHVEEKISLLVSGSEVEAEDIELQLMGYILLVRIARMRAARSGA